MLRKMRRGMRIALLAAMMSTTAAAEDFPAVTNAADCAALDTAGRTNWVARMIPPGPQNFRNDLGIVGFAEGFNLTNLAAVVSGSVTTYPLEIIETTSSPVARLFIDAASSVVFTSSPPAGYSQWTWTTNTYGSPGAWVTGAELDQWKADRWPIRQRVAIHLISTSAIPAYLAQLTNAVPVYSEDGTNFVSLLALYSNDIAIVGINAAPVPNALFHAPTNVTRLDIFASTNLVAPRGGWVLLSTRDNTSDPIYYPLGGAAACVSFAAANPDHDTDGDTISDSREAMLYGSDPYAADSDYDGLNDRDEIFRYGSNPFSSDSDGDGLADGAEMAELTNLNNADSDNDGLTDYEELFITFTYPLDPDTDNDGLWDGEEVLEYDTYARSADTDRDGLTDYEEVFEFGTNPHSADTDSDGMDDEYEVGHEFDPTDPSDAAEDEDDNGVSNLTEYQWGTPDIYSSGYPEYQELIMCSAGSNSLLGIYAPNYQVALGDCGPNTAFARVRPFWDAGALVEQKLHHAQIPGIFINGEESTSAANPIVIPAQSTAAVFRITATKAAKGTNMWLRLTNDVNEAPYYDFGRMYVPKITSMEFHAPPSSTSIVYDTTGTLSVAVSSAANPCRIYLEDHTSYIPGAFPGGRYADWIRVRVTGPGASPTNTTVNSYDYRAVLGVNYQYPLGHGIELTQPGVHKIEAGFDMNASGILDDDEVEETCIVYAIKASVNSDLNNDGAIDEEDESLKLDGAADPRADRATHREFMFCNDDLSNGLWDKDDPLTSTNSTLDDDVEEIKVACDPSIGAAWFEHPAISGMSFYRSKDCATSNKLTLPYIISETNPLPELIYVRSETVWTSEKYGDLAFKIGNPAKSVVYVSNSLPLHVVNQVGHSNYFVASRDYILENNTKLHARAYVSGSRTFRVASMREEATLMTPYNAQEYNPPLKGIRAVTNAFPDSTVIINGNVTFFADDRNILTAIANHDMTDRCHGRLIVSGAIDALVSSDNDDDSTSPAGSDLAGPQAKYVAQSGQTFFAAKGRAPTTVNFAMGGLSAIYTNLQHASSANQLVGVAAATVPGCGVIFTATETAGNGGLPEFAEAARLSGVGFLPGGAADQYNLLILDGSSSVALAHVGPEGGLRLVYAGFKHSGSWYYINTYLLFDSTTPR